MDLASNLCWERTVPGRNPLSLLIGEDHVLCSYIADPDSTGESEPHTLACFDMQGRDCWSAHDVRLELVLPGERFLGFRDDKLIVLDRMGRETDGIRDGDKRVACDPAFEFIATRERIFVKTRQLEMLVADRALKLVDRLPLPRHGRGVFAGDGVAYLEDNRIVVLDRSGRTRTLCELPFDLVHDTMDRFERETGRGVLEGVTTATIADSGDMKKDIAAMMQDPSRHRAHVLGDRPDRYDWTLEYDESCNALLLYNFTHPHLIVCIGLDGEARWCAYCDSSCCGGPPIALPNGDLVASSGCGGILTWLDSRGRILEQSRPHPGTGLGPAYSPYVRGLRDSGCTIDSGFGVVAYDADRKLRWIHPGACNRYDYSEQHDLLVTASWKGRGSITIQCIKNPGGSSSAASA